MRKNNSLPELNVNSLTPNKNSLTSGWMTQKKFKFSRKDLNTRQFSILDVKVSGSVLPVPKRLSYTNSRRAPRKTRNKRLSYDYLYNRSLSRKFFTVDKNSDAKISEPTIVDLKTKVKNAEDSDLFAVSDTQRESEENTGRYVGPDAFKHYYRNYK